MPKNILDEMQEKSEAKAVKDKDYHIQVWESHIMELAKLTGHREGEMSWDRYQEIKEELIGYAEARWSNNHEAS